MAVFNTVLEGNNDNSTNASNMISNVSIAYNAADPSQRNALYQAQSRISKSQKSHDSKEKSKAIAKAKAGMEKESFIDDDFETSIFLEGKIMDGIKKKFKFLNKPKKKPSKKEVKKTDTNDRAKQLAQKMNSQKKDDDKKPDDKKKDI